MSEAEGQQLLLDPLQVCFDVVPHSDEFLDLFFAHGFAPERCRFMEENNSAAAVLYWFDCEYRNQKIAYIYAVATAKAHRGKGLCRKLMEHTHNYLKNNGYSGVILVPGSPSLFRFYESMGYKTTCYNHQFTRNKTDDGISLASISKEEYSSLRKSFLDDNAVLQEGANLEFLSSYAVFYKGEDFILAAYKDENLLVCPEILGNTSHSTEIISALGCEKGTFRTQGNSFPFAMFLPLREDAPSPAYFGFAFD